MAHLPRLRTKQDSAEIKTIFDPLGDLPITGDKIALKDPVIATVLNTVQQHGG